MPTPDEEEDHEEFWWIPHLCAAVLGFLVGGYLIAKHWHDPAGADWVLLGAVISALLCAMLSVWFGAGFWSGVRRLFGWH